MRKITLGALVAIAVAVMSQGTTFAATQDMTVAAIRDFTPIIIENTIPEIPNLSNQFEQDGD